MDDDVTALHETLERAFARFVDSAAPPRLAAAMRHAVFVGGKRLRPRLVMQVAAATGGRAEAAAIPAAAIELLHCASLVHDDLPCFDDADTRRGQATVHRRFDEPTAVLAGDALIVLAFELVSFGGLATRRRLQMVNVLARATGANGGLAAGQAAERDPLIPWDAYHHAKTGALFEAAVALGAIVGEGAEREWRPVGTALGMAYQMADDIVDVIGCESSAGKAVQQDDRHGRVNAATLLGLPTAFERLKEQLSLAIAAIPPCPGAAALEAWMVRTAASLYAAHNGPDLAESLRAPRDEPVDRSDA
ncbi:MAG TPA: polyprenyl synthetase family protein [Nannocystaceae bacterium]|nr:polyprenyl synthetase family protein [Nannocystaceae bacterium]